MSKAIKRITSVFMAVLMCLPATLFVSAADPLYTDVVFTKDRGTADRQVILSFKGVTDPKDFAPEMVTWTKSSTGDEYMAYCSNPVLPGYGDVTDYPVDLYYFDDNCIVDAGASGGSGRKGSDPAYNNGADASVTMRTAIEGCIVYGYPSVSAEELLEGTAASFGVSQDHLEYAAYLASKMALWSLIHKSYSNVADWTANPGASAYPTALRTATMNAMIKIRNKALSHTSQPIKAVTLTITTPTKDGAYQIATATVGGDILPGRSNYLSVVGEAVFPSTIKVTGMNGSEYTKTADGNQYFIPNGVTQFKIIVPDAATAQTYTFAFLAATGNKTLLYGKVPNDAVQNYVLAGIGYQGQQATFETEVGDDPTPTPTPPASTPTPTPPPDPTGDGITIYKYSTSTTESGVRIPLQGVTFELINSLGQSLGTKATDTSGTVNWSPLPLGNYHIYERSNNGLPYQLTPPTYQNVTLTVEQPHGIVTFYNDPTQTVTVIKEDSVTGDKIKGVEMELRQIDGNGNFVSVAETDVQGRAVFNNIPDGTYSVREVSTVEPYILDSTLQTVVVKNGQAPSLKFLNSKYPTLTIQKRDADTDEVVTAPATFHVEQKDGALSFDVTTGQSYKLIGTSAGANGVASPGAANITNLPAGTYVISEQIPPAGYVADSIPQTVYLGENRSIQVVVKNTKTPTLQIEKLDSETAKPIPSTIFEVKKLDGTMVGAFTTGADGTVTAGLSTTPGGYLSPGTYRITEIAVPLPYLLPTDGSQTATVVLAAGDTNSITFRNDKAPEWFIEKRDGKTDALITSPATFSVYTGGGAFIGDFTTDATGKVKVVDSQGKALAPGAYRVVEKAAPAGYTRDTEPQWIALKGNQSATTVFRDYEKPTITVLKVDQITGEPLPMAEFRLTERDDASRIINTGFTGADGKFITTDLEPGWYSVTELHPPDGYLLSDVPKQSIEIKAGESVIVKFDNLKMPELTVIKTDSQTGLPLANAEFKIRTADGTSAMEYTYTTDAAGKIVLPKMPAGTYEVTETRAPGAQYILNPQTQTIQLSGGDKKVITFENTLKPTLIIRKTNGLTLTPVPNTKYKIEREVGGALENIGTFTTDANGMIVLPYVEPGWYVYTETAAAPGMQLPSNLVSRMYLAPGENSYTADGAFTVPGDAVNWPTNSIVIKKTSATTNELLANAVFGLYRADEQVSGVPGTLIGRYTTDATGVVVVTGLPSGYYVVKEEQAPPNYLVGENSMQNGFLKPDGTTVLEFTFSNIPYGSILVAKKDGDTSKPLPGAVFKVTDASGTVIGSANGLFTTDSNGEILIPHVKPGSYIISEERAPANYALDAAPQVTEVGTDGKTYRVDFINTKLGSAQIIKKDAGTKQPLKNALFTVYKASGEVVGTYETDGDGLIILPHLANGWYKAVESRAPEGYLLDDTPKDFQITGNDFVKLVFENTKLTGLQLKKKDATTKDPIGNVTFSVSRMNGEEIGDFTTGKDGLVFVPNLAPGWYTVVETKAADGYFIDAEPKNIEVKRGQNAVLEVENTAAASLLLVKTDAQTGKPLGNVLYEIRRADGQRVVGNLQDGNQPGTANNSPNHYAPSNGDVLGFYLTDANGRILINHLAPGEYQAIERQQPDGYELDENVYPVTVTPGKQAVLRLTNKPLAGLRLLKRDSVSKLGIYNVEFMLFEAGTNKVVGTFYTDNMGVINFPRDIPAGRYTLRETRAAEGYYRDDVPRTVEFVAGKVTEIVWENVPQMAQIQVTKLSADDNEINGLLAGTPLADAVFEIITYKSGNVVDRVVTGTNGRAVSKPLPLGRYLVKEVQAPAYYRLNSKELDVTLEFATQIVKLEFQNYSANTGVFIKKTGNLEAMPGQTIRYDIKAVQNQSTVPLSDFYWRDVLPVDAVRLEKIVTGSYNQSLRYKIIAQTNKGNQRIIADSLSTTVNQVIDCSPTSLGLASDEFIVSFGLYFGAVKAGFTCVEPPQVYVTVNKNLPNGYPFSNKVDVGGRYNGEWIIGNSTWRTVIYRGVDSKLPKTGH